MKPLNKKSYGSIGHLIGSRTGPTDKTLPRGQCDICTVKPRDKYDIIIVQEKLDGSNVGVAKIGRILVALTRSGHTCWSSPYIQHNLFARWLDENFAKFSFLKDGERVCGEWLALAHGTRYDLSNKEPFVAFDIFDTNNKRLVYKDMIDRIDNKLATPSILSYGPSISIAKALDLLNPEHHGAIDPIEGCVWRIERAGKVDFLAKYVRPDKKDGCYLPEISGGDPIWNWEESYARRLDF